MISSQSLYELLQSQAAAFPDQSALNVKHHGHYLSLSYSALHSRILQFAAGLASLGIRKGDRVAIMSFNRPEWVIADMAILFLGAVVVPLYPTLGSSEIQHILNDSGAVCLVFETETHLHQVLQSMAFCPALSHLVSMVDSDLCPPSCVYFDRLFLDSSDLQPERVSRDDLASIVYTSGTTGLSKGVMLSHGNILSNVSSILKAVSISSADSVLSFLPLSHVFERVVGYYTILAAGGTIYYAESIATVNTDLLLVRPTIVVSVPRLYEKIHARIFASLSGVKRVIFNWALSIGLKYSPLLSTNRSFLSAFLLCVADRLVFKTIRAKTGGRLRFFVSGSASLSVELSRFFAALGLLIIEGYGQTESSPVITCNTPDVYQFGTVGKPLPDVQCKLSPDGELLAKGPNIMKGYYHLPGKTAEALDSEGWLHTGDVAVIQPDGFIRIVDRVKDLIVLSNGKKISPQVVEAALKKSPYIFQSVVTGDGRNFVTALIVPDVELLAARFPQWTDKGSLLMTLPDLRAFISSEIDRCLFDLSPYEKIKKFEFLAHPFTEENGQLTPTLKPKRKLLFQTYAALIESMYTSKEL